MNLSMMKTLHVFFLYIYFTDYNNFSAKRTFVHKSWADCDQYILDKVLSDERSATYATSIDDILLYWQGKG